jgi:hypothetical protein
MIIIVALAGLLAGLLIAVAWTAGCRQGRADVLATLRALHRTPDQDPHVAGNDLLSSRR